jgi:hypothetical protein
MLKLLSSDFVLSQKDTFCLNETIQQEDSKAKVFLVLELNGEKKETVAKKIKSIFIDKFFKKEEELLARFEDCIKDVNDFLKEEKLKINGIIAVQENNELHVTQTGEGEAYLIRRGKLDVIVENISSQEENEDVFDSIASGEIFIDDKVVFTSLRVLRYAIASQIVAVFQEGLTEGSDSLKELLEIEAGRGSLLSFHIRGDSVFNSALKDNIKVPRNLRASFLTKLVNYFDQLVDIISQKVNKPYDTVKNSLVMGTVSVFTIVLVWGVFSLSVNNQEQELREKNRLSLLKIENELSQAERQMLINEIESANVILNKQETELNNILNDGMFRKEVLTLQEKIQNYRDQANKITRFKSLTEYQLANLTEKLGENNLLGVFRFNDELYVYSEDTLYKVVLDHVEEIAKITENSQILRAIPFNDRDTVVFALADNTYREYTNGEIITAKTSDEAGFKSSVSETTYSRYLYLLSQADQMIYKYERKRGGFTGASEWLQEETDLSQAIDLAIDGSIYVLNQGGGIDLFYKGKKVALNIKMPNSENLEGVSKIYTKQDMNNVYLYNPDRNSIIKLEMIQKGLEYQKEYLIEADTKIQGFNVDRDEQRLFVVGEKEVFELSL